MGRIQSSIGLITGTDIVGTVDQLIAISARPRDRLLARTETLQREQQAIAELTASVIGVQLAGNQLANTSVFRSKKGESSNADAVSVEAGNASLPGTHVVRTLRTAATHSTGSLQRFAATDQPLGICGLAQHSARWRIHRRIRFAGFSQRGTRCRSGIDSHHAIVRAGLRRSI